MLCEWERVRGEHPPPILARAPSGARAFIFSRHPLSARWACVLSGTLASPRPGALTVCLARRCGDIRPDAGRWTNPGMPADINRAHRAASRRQRSNGCFFLWIHCPGTRSGLDSRNPTARWPWLQIGRLGRGRPTREGSGQIPGAAVLLSVGFSPLQVAASGVPATTYRGKGLKGSQPQAAPMPPGTLTKVLLAKPRGGKHLDPFPILNRSART